MRKKEIKIIVSFYTIADAMAMEKGCKAYDIEGRLIPVPRQISAGCGIAWSSPPGERERLTQVLNDIGIDTKEMMMCEI